MTELVIALLRSHPGFLEQAPPDRNLIFDSAPMPSGESGLISIA
jgi:hypothetical protein